MSSSFTVGKADLEKPGVGDDVDTWYIPNNGNFDVIDACFSASVSIALSSGTVTLTQAQMRCQRVTLTGSLSGNARLNFFAAIPGLYVVNNAVTLNGFTVTLGQNAGATISPATGAHTLVFVDGTNVILGDGGTATAAIPPGALQDFAMSSAPSGWLVCNGAAVSRTTYAALFSNIGTAWGGGDGSTTFNTPNLYGQFRRTWDQSGTVDPARSFASAQTDAYASHTHGLNDPGHSHVTSFQTGSVLTGTAFVTLVIPGSSNTTTNTTGISMNASGSGTETRVKNYAVLTCVKT